MTPQKTFCRICEAHCGLDVERDGAGGLIKLRPDRAHPITQGFVCAKGLRFPEVASHPDRLLAPQLRQPDGSLRQVSWDQALDDAGARLKAIIEQHGPDAVAVYFGTTLIHNTMGILTTFRFVRALGTRNLFSAGSLDNNNKFAAARIIHGNEFIHPIMDLEHADLAILLGTNPLVSQGSFLRMEGGSTAYDRFIARGGRLMIIDPRRSESAERWGGHLPIRPGTDIFLLLALLNQLRDRHQPDPRMRGLEELLALAGNYPPAHASALTGIPEATIIDLAIQLRSTVRTTFFMSVGVNQGPFGTLCSIALQALAALTGNLDRRGGLLFQPLGKHLTTLLAPRSLPSRIGHYPATIGGLPCGILADEIRTPGTGQIRALIVIGGNPLTAAPDGQALRAAFAQLDLLISIDLFENQTGALAHMLLPSTSWLERCDVASWDSLVERQSVLQASAAVQPPPGAVRPEYWILSALSQRIGKPLFGSELAARAWQHAPWDRWIPSALRLLARPFRRSMQGVEGMPWMPPRPGTYLRGRRRIHFWSPLLLSEVVRLRTYEAALTAPADPGMFTLLGRRHRLAQNSWIHGALRGGTAEEWAWLAPEDMANLGLHDGDSVVIEGNGAAITIPVAGHTSLTAGIVVVPHGLPRINVNVLIPSGDAWIEPLSGMHHLSGHRVSVRPAETLQRDNQDVPINASYSL